MAGLGIASGVISVLQAAERLSDLLKKIKVYQEATDEVLALTNEVSDLQLILTEYRNVAQELNHANSALRLRLQKLLEDTGEKIDEIDRLIRLTLIRNGQIGQLKVNKMAWVRKKSEVDQLRQELKDKRQNIAEHFAIITLRSQSRVGIQIDQISVDTVGLGTHQQQILQRVEQTELNVLDTMSVINLEQRVVLEDVVLSHRQIERRLGRTEDVVTSMLHSQQDSHRMIHELMLEMSSFTGGLTPQANVKIISYFSVETGNKFRKYSSVGDISSIRQMFAEGLMSPDSMSSGGWMPLTRALRTGCIDVCELLLSLGANPELIDSSGRSAMDMARLCEFETSVFSPKSVRRIIGLFPKDNDEISSLSTLHQIILGLSPKPLTEYLNECNGPLDKSTIWGRTALEWAISRSDHSAVKYLLQYESDEALRQSLAESLMWRVMSIECLEVLLATGAKIDVFGANSPQTLSTTTVTCITLDRSRNYMRHPNQMDLLSYILERGANPNQPSQVHETTLLSTSAFADSVEVAALLLNYGADVNLATGVQQKRAVLFILWLNAHNCLRLLLDHGLDCSLNPIRYMTILHVVAKDSDVETMEILAGTAIRGIDIDARDADRRTARELLRLRPGYTPELNEAFEALIFSIRSPIEDRDSDSDNEGERFEDAREHFGSE